MIGVKDTGPQIPEKGRREVHCGERGPEMPVNVVLAQNCSGYLCRSRDILRRFSVPLDFNGNSGLNVALS